MLHTFGQRSLYTSAAYFGAATLIGHVGQPAELAPNCKSVQSKVYGIPQCTKNKTDAG